MATPAKCQKLESSAVGRKTLIFYVPQKIQRGRLSFIIAGAKKNSFPITNTFGPRVTHVITELESRRQVCEQMKITDLRPNVEVLSLSWHYESMRQKVLVPTEGHRLPAGVCEEPCVEAGLEGDHNFEYACERVTLLHHGNTKFTRPFEILEKEAEFRGTDNDLSRALAFRRAACVLKSLPYQLCRLSQVRDRRHIGDHMLKVLKEVLEDGRCKETDRIESSPRFRQMALFTEVFGVGPTTAKKWISMGLTSIPDAINCPQIRQSMDSRLAIGLAYHTDLTLPVRKVEGDTWREFIQLEALNLTPGVSVELTGGFRRGKAEGHDVDLLISHPVEGQEQGLLPRLVRRLHQLGIVLYGHYEKSTYGDHVLQTDRGVYLRSTLDHFEKWIGVVKMSNTIRDQTDNQSMVPNGGDNVSNLISDNVMTSDNVSNHTLDDISNVHHDEPGTSQDSSPYRIIPGSLRRLFLSPRTGPGMTEDQEHMRTTTTEQTVAAAVERAEGQRDWYARRVDLIIAPASQYYYALVGWTGSKHFNRSLRYYGKQELGLKLSSHGLWDPKQKRALAAHSEKDVFDNLKLTYRHPWERNC